MQRRVALYVLCVWFVLCIGCGGASPTDPIAMPSGVAVLDGRTGKPVASLSGIQATQGQALSLTAPGFLTLKTVYRGSPIHLWTNDAFLPLSVTRGLVYLNHEPEVLLRWPGTVNRLSIILDETLQSTPWTRARTETAAAIVSRAHTAIDVAIGSDGPLVRISYAPHDEAFDEFPNAAMVAYIQYTTSGIITDARVLVRSLDIDGFWYGEKNFQIAIAHELVHTTGLIGHLPLEVKGLMSSNADSYAFTEPTATEELVMKLHYNRLSGTTLTQDVENEGGQAVTARVHDPIWHLVCVR